MVIQNSALYSTDWESFNSVSIVLRNLGKIRQVEGIFVFFLSIETTIVNDLHFLRV